MDRDGELEKLVVRDIKTKIIEEIKNGELLKKLKNENCTSLSDLSQYFNLSYWGGLYDYHTELISASVSSIKKLQMGKRKEET